MNLDFRTKKEIEQHQRAQEIKEAISEIKNDQKNRVINIKRDFQKEHERFKKEMAELKLKADRRDQEERLGIDKLKNELSETKSDRIEFPKTKKRNIESEAEV